jgi:arylsulfatase A-like enzyme
LCAALLLTIPPPTIDGGDDVPQGFAGIGAHSAAEGLTHTPNFDAAVSEGVLLERHYTFFWCAPTRAAFMVRTIS